MALTKPAGTWTYDDLLSLPDDGRRYEIIEGALYEMPSPGLAHARVVRNLIMLLVPLLAKLGGELLAAPLDVFFTGANPVQPDLVGMLSGGEARGVPRGIEGPPDLLIEVLSPSSRNHDVLTKRALYGQAGVREYWLVDPETRTLTMLTLDRDALHLAVTATGSDLPASPLFGDLPFTVSDIFAGTDQ
jgi:Uma2 family endonuclease